MMFSIPFVGFLEGTLARPPARTHARTTGAHTYITDGHAFVWGSYEELQK